MVNSRELLVLIDKHFNEEDLRTLCFYLDVDYDSLPAVGKRHKVRELILLCQREVRVEDLVKECQEQRPNIDWTELAVHDGIVPLIQVHGYSGEQVRENRF